jgi:hypothetical protein
VVVVREDSGRVLDIVEVRGSSQTLLGTVGPGSTVLGLTSGSDSGRYLGTRAGT